MPSSVTERTNLLEPRGLDLRCFGRDASCRIDHGFIDARLIVRHPPTLACARFVRPDE
jgi:hypothetical protein